MTNKQKEWGIKKNKLCPGKVEKRHVRVTPFGGDLASGVKRAVAEYPKKK
jgi:hypothetical protein